MSAQKKAKAVAPAKDGWKDRLIEVKRMRVGDILPHERNPRRHPKQQLEPLKGMLAVTLERLSQMNLEPKLIEQVYA